MDLILEIVYDVKKQAQHSTSNLHYLHNMIAFQKTNALSHEQKAQVIALWNAHYPENLEYKNPDEFDQYLSGLEDAKHILLFDDDQILGWYVDFNRENERWFAMIIHRSIQGMGYGGVLLDKGQQLNDSLNGWVIESSDYKLSDGRNYRSPLPFYQKNGFQLVTESTLEAKGLEMVRIAWSK